MKTLVLGDCNSIWVREFIRNVLLPLKHQVFVTADSKEKISNYDFYKENDIPVIFPDHVSHWINQIPKVRVFYNRIKRRQALKKFKGQFDIIIVIYVTSEALSQAKVVKTENGKVISFFIGSDILRSGDRNTEILSKKLSELNSTVVCEGYQTSKSYDLRIGRKNNIKSNIIFLGNSIFPYIDDNMKLGVSYCKNQFKIDQEKISICIGYNASEAQQHFQVIEALNNMPENIKNKVFLIMPMAYGGTTGYIEKVRSKMESTTMKYVILTQYLDFNHAAQLRVATDIFINAQVTDAFSATLQECIYAGSKIFSGSWLKYEELERCNISLEQFSTFQELCSKIIVFLNQDNNSREYAKENLLKRQTWQFCKDHWERLLK